MRVDSNKLANAHLLRRDVEVLAFLVGATLGHVLDRPGEWAHERHDQVDEGPSDDDVVVGDDAEGGEDGGEADSRKAGVDSTEHTDVTALELLAERELHESDGDANREEANEVGYEEESAAPRVAEVGETPEVSEADTVADHSKNESGAREPSSSFRAFVLVRETLDKAIPAAHLFFKLNYKL